MVFSFLMLRAQLSLSHFPHDAASMFLRIRDAEDARPTCARYADGRAPWPGARCRCRLPLPANFDGASMMARRTGPASVPRVGRRCRRRHVRATRNSDDGLDVGFVGAISSRVDAGGAFITRI